MLDSFDTGLVWHWTCLMLDSFNTGLIQCWTHSIPDSFNTGLVGYWIHLMLDSFLLLPFLDSFLLLEAQLVQCWTHSILDSFDAGLIWKWTHLILDLLDAGLVWHWTCLIWDSLEATLSKLDSFVWSRTLLFWHLTHSKLDVFKSAQFNAGLVQHSAGLIWCYTRLVQHYVGLVCPFPINRCNLFATSSPCLFNSFAASSLLPCAIKWCNSIATSSVIMTHLPLPLVCCLLSSDALICCFLVLHFPLFETTHLLLPLFCSCQLLTWLIWHYLLFSTSSCSLPPLSQHDLFATSSPCFLSSSSATFLPRGDCECKKDKWFWTSTCFPGTMSMANFSTFKCNTKDF